MLVRRRRRAILFEWCAFQFGDPVLNTGFCRRTRPVVQPAHLRCPLWHEKATTRQQHQVSVYFEPQEEITVNQNRPSEIVWAQEEHQGTVQNPPAGSQTTVVKLSSDAKRLTERRNWKEGIRATGQSFKIGLKRSTDSSKRRAMICASTWGLSLYCRCSNFHYASKPSGSGPKLPSGPLSKTALCRNLDAASSALLNDDMPVAATAFDFGAFRQRRPKPRVPHPGLR